MAQEQINGFKKVTQQWGTSKVATEIDGEYARVTGANYLEFRGAVKTNNMVNGYGTYHPMIGTQPLYTWTHMVPLVTYGVNDAVTIYDGTSLSPDLNPFARILGDDFDECVIWPLEFRIIGNGYDYSNYLSVTLECTGTHWMSDDSTYNVFSSVSATSYTSVNVNSIANSFAWKADSSVMEVNTTYFYETGTAADSDHTFNVLCTLACQKIDM